ncbi:MAG TPA: hypothetical protein PKD83_12465 [Ignavibacteria bacterium]|nr:hypothetical protein [Ignavibacteria bacterium]
MLNYIDGLKGEELIRFEKFINSPYFNSNKNSIKFFTFLKEHKKFNPKNVSAKKNAFTFVYKTKVYDDLKFRKLVSDYIKLTEKFLMYSEFENYSPRNRIMLLSSLRKKGYSKRFETNMSELFAEQKKSFQKDDDYYINQITLEIEYYSFYFNRFQTEFADCLQDKSNNLDYYFVFCKLHNFLEMYNNEVNKGVTSGFNKTFYTEVIDFVEKNKLLIQKKHPNLFIIYNVLQMFVTSDNYYLKELTNYLKLNANKLKHDKLKHYYNYLLSFYTMQINKGKTEYRPEMFKVFEYMYMKNLFVIDNVLTDQEYSSIINNSLALGEYEWADKFLMKYNKFIDPVIANDAFHLGKAKIYFYTKNYEELYPHLNEVKYIDSVYYFNSKVLLAKVYFETRNINSLEYVVENLKQYIRGRETLTAELTSTAKIFIKCIYALIRIIEEPNVKKRRSAMLMLKKELDNSKKFVSSKNWFYEKLYELK